MKFKYGSDFEYIAKNFEVDKLKGCSILITGVSGFIASYLIKFFTYLNSNMLKETCSLYLLGRSRDKILDKLYPFENLKSVRIIEQDVNNPLTIDSNIDYIIHAASISSTKLFSQKPVEVMLANSIGLQNILEFALKKNVKSVLFLSSGAVYGDIPQDIKQLQEHHYFPLNFLNLENTYAESKRFGELLMRSYYQEYGLPCKCVRISHTYGPGIDLNDGHVYSDFTKSLCKHEDIILNSDGLVTRPFCYVADAALALLIILFDGVNGDVYNMANNTQTFAIYELAEILSQKLLHGTIKVHRKETFSGKKPVYVKVDTTKLENFGWKPKIDVVSGFQKTMDSFKYGATI